uniref:Beta-1,4-glucuronyltransferase 1 n=1 Tax=Calidris pygmaea TaxID=425635 RepID=A0A8C3KN78_9CHAR
MSPTSPTSPKSPKDTGHHHPRDSRAWDPPKPDVPNVPKCPRRTWDIVILVTQGMETHHSLMSPTSPTSPTFPMSPKNMDIVILVTQGTGTHQSLMSPMSPGVPNVPKCPRRTWDIVILVTQGMETHHGEEERFWGGPLSVAVFGVPRRGLQELAALLGGPCRGLRPRLRLHVVVGAADPPPPPLFFHPPPPRLFSTPPSHPPKCRGALRRLETSDPPSYTLGVPYPGNLLRNVAWEGAAAPHLPPKNGGFLREDATSSSWDRVVFVLPAFEVRTGTRVPRTKAELLQLVETGDARPFYGALCPRCQGPTGYGRWWGLPPAPHLRVAYEVAWKDPWEPFYVGPAHGVPPFDEGFLQYGFNRISQVPWGWGEVAMGWPWGWGGHGAAVVAIGWPWGLRVLRGGRGAGGAVGWPWWP